MKILVTDLEADGLIPEATKIWCASFFDVSTKRSYSFTDYKEIRREMETADHLIGHNILGYDWPLMDKLMNWSPSPEMRWATDTWEMSVTLKPDRPRPRGMPGRYGPHSVESLARMAGAGKKLEIENWTDLHISEYIKRGEQDVYLEYMVFLSLLDEMGVTLNDYFKEVLRDV